jgi:hypothetical protein
MTEAKVSSVSRLFSHLVVVQVVVVEEIGVISKASTDASFCRDTMRRLWYDSRARASHAYWKPHGKIDGNELAPSWLTIAVLQTPVTRAMLSLEW